MKHQINLLHQLQELVLTRDEHHRVGDGSHMASLDQSIEDLESKLDAQPKALYERLYKKDHVVMAPMANGCCAVCGMSLPISQVQQVRLAKSIQTCASCGRILFNEEEDAPRYVGERPARGEVRKTGVSRFSAEGLMVTPLASGDAEGAIGELAAAMQKGKFISNADALVHAAMEREAVLTTAAGNGIAFPHVRGVEGGGLTLALGTSANGVDFAGEKVNIVFFSVIPMAVSAFYLRLMAGLAEAFSKQTNRSALVAAKTPAALWKAFIKATRYTIK